MTPLEEFNLNKDPSARQRKTWDTRREKYGPSGLSSTAWSAESRASHSAKLKKIWSDPEFRERLAGTRTQKGWETRRLLYGPTGVRSYKKRQPVSAEARITQSERMKRRWLDPEYRARQEAHLRAIQAKGSAAGNLANRARKFVPKRGTPEQNYYEKVRLILGTEAAKRALGL